MAPPQKTQQPLRRSERIRLCQEAAQRQRELQEEQERQQTREIPEQQEPQAPSRPIALRTPVRRSASSARRPRGGGVISRTRRRAANRSLIETVVHDVLRYLPHLDLPTHPDPTPPCPPAGRDTPELESDQEPVVNEEMDIIVTYYSTSDSELEFT